MITEQDLREAIAECEGTRNPNAGTCIKLAAFYSLLEHLYGKPINPGYSFSEHIEIPYSDTPFSQAVEKVGIEKAYPVIDELMEMLYVTNRPLYESVMMKIE